MGPLELDVDCSRQAYKSMSADGLYGTVARTAEQITGCRRFKMTTSRERSDWYEEFGRVLLFVVLQASNTGISSIVDCATFEFNSSQIVETVEFVTHFLWNTGLFSMTWNESGCNLHDRLKIYNFWSTVPYFVCTAPGKSHETWINIYFILSIS